MSTKIKKSMEAAEEASREETAISPGDTPAEDISPDKNAALEAFFRALPDPCVYCGPSVRGVTRQYNVYNGGIPEVLKEFVKEHPAAKGLLVSLDRFPQTRIRLETRGTAEAILFHKIAASL